jgi:hypothetical protein
MSQRNRTHITWYDTVATLPANWDHHLPKNHFLLRNTLAAHERALLPHLKTSYAAMHHGDVFVGQAAFQVLTLQEKHLNPFSLKGWQRVAWKAFANAGRPRLLVAGQLFRHDVVSFHWVDNLSPFDAFRYYRTAIDAALKKNCAYAVLVKEPPEVLVPYFQHQAPEYLLLRNDSSMQLIVPPEWTSFIHYEKSLKHKYAQRLRKVRQSMAALEVKELTSTDVAASAASIYELYLQVTANQPVRLGMLSKAFLPELKRHYGERLKVWGFYEEGQIIAFVSAWVQKYSFDMFYIGFDYARNSALQLYFNILFFAIEQAIVQEKPQLVLGRTALEAKARVGCKPTYLSTFLYIRNPVLRSLVGRLQQRFTEGAGEWENRHPFKKDQ